VKQITSVGRLSAGAAPCRVTITDNHPGSPKGNVMHSEELFAAYAEFTTPADLSAASADAHTGSRNTATPTFLSYAESRPVPEHE